MLAEFTRPDAPEQVVATAGWDGRRVTIGDDDQPEPELAEALRRIFRPVPVVADDPSLRSVGTEGPAMLEPGDLQWFMAAARSRAEREGLAVRLVSTGAHVMGWDPAGAYRTFAESVERRNRIGSAEP
jgi:hypothetical protein